MLDKLSVFMEGFKDWASDRITERSTLDGVVLVSAALIFLFLKPIATIAAYVALVYGVWTIIKEDW